LHFVQSKSFHLYLIYKYAASHWCPLPAIQDKTEVLQFEDNGSLAASDAQKQSSRNFCLSKQLESNRGTWNFTSTL